jgi:hypothetical protein
MKKFMLGSMLGLLIVASSSFAGSVGARLWYADYTFTQPSGDVDLDYAPMFLLQFDGQMGNTMRGSLMLGAGQWKYTQANGVDATDTRFDFLAGLTWQFKYWYLGVALHPLFVNQEDDSDRKFMTVYAGPEILTGASVPLVRDRLFLRGGLSVLPVVGAYNRVEIANGDTADAFSVTYGYSLDLGLVVAVSNWRFGGGYKLFNLAEYDYTLKDENDNEAPETSLGENFGGPYVMASINW